MIKKIEYQKIASIAIKTVSKYSKCWNKATFVTGYCHKEYKTCALSYNDEKSKEISYWGEKYTDVGDEIYSFEGCDYLNEILKNHYIPCQNNIDLRWNEGKITIYPNGEYESSFIWDNEAHLNYLLNNIYARKQIFVENIFTSFDFEEEGFDSQFGYISVVIDIKKRQEILTERKITTTNGEIKEIGLDLPKHHIEAILDFQLQTNELELGERAIKWNRATFSIPADIYSFDPDKDVSFEWVEENA